MTLIRSRRRPAGPSACQDALPRSLVSKVPSSASQPARSKPHQGRTLERAEQRASPRRRGRPQQRRGQARGRPTRYGTTFFRRMREMRFLTRCRRRHRGLYADGARHNGLREVGEARSSGLHAPNVPGSHPANFGFCGKKLHFAGKSRIFLLGPPSRNGKPDTPLIWRKNIV